MNFSVIIPAYNCEETIQSALESVFRQTEPPFEVLAMDDGSTDRTPAILDAYRPRVTVFRQPNRGVGAARDALCERVRGDVVAALDADDLWHPKYLQVQREILQAYPGAVASFTGHVNFEGSQNYEWKNDPAPLPVDARVIPGTEFIREYNSASGPFASFSYSCVRTDAMRSLGKSPFRLRLNEDLYFFNSLALIGPVLYVSVPLVAYRIRGGSLSSDRLVVAESTVRTFELLEERFNAIRSKPVARGFYRARAIKRRLYAKALMGAGRTQEARAQAARSVLDCSSATSLAKSAVLLLLTYAPPALQPRWPRSGPDSRSGALR